VAHYTTIEVLWRVYLPLRIWPELDDFWAIRAGDRAEHPPDGDTQGRNWVVPLTIRTTSAVPCGKAVAARIRSGKVQVKTLDQGIM
jgi:hypothetical protein